MSSTRTRWRWEQTTLHDINTWLPVFGNWCGPGWSGGKRTKHITEEIVQQGPVMLAETGRPSIVDALCKQHDLSYHLAQGHVNEAALVIEADIALLTALAELNTAQLSAKERQYIFLMKLALTAKMKVRDKIHPGLTQALLRE